MKVAISSAGTDINAGIDPRFGRSPYFLIIDPQTLNCEALVNPYINALGSAGIQSAQFIGNTGAEVVLTGQVGPNAFRTLSVIGVKIYHIMNGTVRQAIEAFNSGRLPVVSQPEPGYAGLEGSMSRGGRRQGRGGGRGNGRGAQGRGRRGIFGSGFSSPSAGTALHRDQNRIQSQTPPEAEMRTLRQQANWLGKQLEEISKRLRELEATDHTI